MIQPGDRFGHLTVLRTEGNRVLCRCDCGNETRPYKSNLLQGRTKTCGCSLSRKIQPGDCFGHLTVLRVDKQLITCRCDCGNEKVINYNSLVRGTSSCGCKQYSKANFLKPGTRFGRLTVIEYIGHSIWRCRCDCGNEKNISTSHLTSGSVKSCGCLKKDITEAGLSLLGDHQQVIAPGQQFGHLTVIKYAGDSRWLCRCDCGNEKVISRTLLLSGSTKTCGCRRRKDIPAGTRFGRLTVLRFEGGKILCRCDCGNEKAISRKSLVAGNTKSCGCIERGRKPIEISPGTRFGLLTVICSDKQLITCRCDCGNEKVVRKTSLIHGNAKSCGCLGRGPRSIHT